MCVRLSETERAHDAFPAIVRIKTGFSPFAMNIKRSFFANYHENSCFIIMFCNDTRRLYCRRR